MTADYIQAPRILEISTLLGDNALFLEGLSGVVRPARKIMKNLFNKGDRYRNFDDRKDRRKEREPRRS